MAAQTSSKPHWAHYGNWVGALAFLLVAALGYTFYVDRNTTHLRDLAGESERRIAVLERDVRDKGERSLARR